MEATSSELLQRTSYVGRTRAVITAGYFGSFFGIGLCLSSLGPVLPALGRRCSAPVETMGMLFAARSMGYVFGSILGGVIFDRLSRPHVPLVVGNALCAISCAVLPSLHSVATLGVAVVAQGLCMGFLDTGGNVLLIWLQGPGRVEPYMQAMHFMFALGAVLAPLLVEASTTVAADPNRFDAAFYIMAAAISLATLPLVATRGPRPPAKGSEHSEASNSAATTSEAADASCANGSAVATSSTAVDVQVAKRAPPARQLRCSLEALLVTGSSVCLLFYVGAEVSYGGFVFTYASDYLGMSTTAAHALNAAYWGGLAAGRLLAIPIASMLAPHVMLLIDFACTIASAAALLMVGRGGGASGGALEWIATVGLGLSHASIFPTVLTHAERYMSLSGRITSLFVVCSAVGEAAFPLLVALTYPSGPTSFLWINLGLSVGQLAAFAFARTAAREIAHQRQPQTSDAPKVVNSLVIDAVEMAGAEQAGAARIVA